MTKPSYTLPWILPFVRTALRHTGNFEYRHYVTALWSALEAAKIPGVIRTPANLSFSGQVFQYDRAPHELHQVTTEAFYYLFHKGYITPDPPDSTLNQPLLHQFHVTPRGHEWFSGREPYPEEAVEYMKFLHSRITQLDSVIEQYIVETLIAYERESYFAAAVMLGAASEKALYLLAEVMLGAFKEVQKRDKLKSLLDGRKLLGLLEYVRDTIQSASNTKALPYSVHEGAATHLMSLYEAIRVQRNDAVHPMNAAVSADSVRLLIQSFPYSLSKTEELRAWFAVNPNSI